MGLKDLLFTDDGKSSKKKKAEQKDQEEVSKEEVTKDPLEYIATNPPRVDENPKKEEEESSIFAVPNQEIINSIWSAVVARDLPGPDYLELKTTAKGLESFIPDDSQRLPAAFNFLTQGATQLTKQIILDSIETYKGIVDEERKLGLEELKESRKEKIGDKEDKLKSLKEEASNYQKQIEALQEKLQQSSIKINKLSAEIMSEKSELDTKEKTFQLSVDSVLKTLNTDKEKIDKSIQ